MRKHFSLVVLLGFLSFFGSALGGTIYVNKAAGGGNTGLDWANAFIGLEHALGSANLTSGDNIWVAGNCSISYSPHVTNRAAKFVIPTGVDLFDEAGAVTQVDILSAWGRGASAVRVWTGRVRLEDSKVLTVPSGSWTGLMCFLLLGYDS